MKRRWRYDNYCDWWVSARGEVVTVIAGQTYWLTGLVDVEVNR